MMPLFWVKIAYYALGISVIYLLFKVEKLAKENEELRKKCELKE